MPVNIQELLNLLKASGRAKEPGARNTLLQFMLASKPKSAGLARLAALQQAQYIDLLKHEGFESIISPNPFEPPSEEDLEPGEILIGNVLDRDQLGFEFRLPISLFTEHLGIFGHSGTGKSYALRLITTQLMRAGVPVWFLDDEGEYADLAALFSPESLLVIGCKNFKRNTYEVLPGEEPIDTLNRVKDVWRSSLYIRDGSENLVGDLLHSMFHKRGIFDGSQNFPTQWDVNQELARLRYRSNTRNSGFLETLANRSTNLVNYMGPTYDCVTGFDLEALMKKSVVFTLRKLNETSKEFFRNDLFKAIQAIKSSLVSKLELVIVIDEAHRTFSKAKEARSDMGEPIPYQMVRTLRKRGIGFIVSDQIPSEIHPAVIGNLGTRITFRLLDGHCIKALGESMSLSPEQRAYIPQIPKRVAIIQAGNHPIPFLLQVPELDFSVEIREDELQARLEAVRPLLSWLPREAGVDAGPGVDEKKAKKNDAASWPGVTKDALDYLIEITKDPFLPVTKRDDALGLSDWKGSALREELLSAGLVAKEVINTHRRGGMVTLMRVTDTGYVMLDALKVKHNRLQGKGAYVHQFWQAMIAKWAVAQGYKAEIEAFQDGKACDVAVEMNSRRCAFEVVNQKWEKEIINFSKDVFVGFDEIVFCCADREIIKKLSEKITALFGEESKGKVSFRLLASFAEGL